MLFFYFLSRFLRFFFCFFGAFTFLFAATNLFLRLSMVQSFAMIPLVFGTMVPLVALYALPFSAVLAVSMVFNALARNDELLFFYFFSKARRAFVLATVFFSFLVAACYLPLVLEWAPQSYIKGKELVVEAARAHLHELPINILHSPIPGVAFYCKNKQEIMPGRYQFENLFFALNNKNNERYVFCAQSGIMCQHELELVNGSMHVQVTGRFYHAFFEKTLINLGALFYKEQANSFDYHLKLWGYKRLYEEKDSNPHVFIELHKRLSQGLWQFIMPLLAIFLLFFVRKKQYEMVSSLLLSGVLFLSMYCCTALGGIFIAAPLLSLVCFYGIPSIILLGCYSLYRSRI
ncbi:LptF/LptG family permease [Candidatus Babeliales bacterium]|nr:LptF/LptG family permease [Candidatus Babeliales bacterium]